MATVKTILDTRYVKNGQSPVKIRVTHNRQSTYISTKIYVEPAHFDPNSLTPISKKSYMSAEKNRTIFDMVHKFDEIIFELQRSDDLDIDAMSVQDIRNYLVAKKEPKRKKVAKATAKISSDFMDFFDKYGASKGNDNTRRHYAYVWRVLYEYCTYAQCDHMTFEDVTYERLNDIERWIASTGRGEATRYKVFSYIRSSWNEAERLELVEYGRSPFRFFPIRPVPVSDDILTCSLDGLRRLISLELTDGSQLARARDLIVLSFLLCGPDLIDLYYMSPATDDEVVYVRHKTEGARSVHIFIEPEIRLMLDMYKGENHLTYISERYPNYRTFQRNNNRACAQLSKMIGEHINMEIIRRTWTTIAADIDAPERVKDKSMGHVDKGVKDRHYERYNWEKTKLWNRRVIDYVLYGIDWRNA